MNRTASKVQILELWPHRLTSGLQTKHNVMGMLPEVVASVWSTAENSGGTGRRKIQFQRKFNVCTFYTLEHNIVAILVYRRCKCKG